MTYVAVATFGCMLTEPNGAPAVLSTKYGQELKAFEVCGFSGSRSSQVESAVGVPGIVEIMPAVYQLITGCYAPADAGLQGQTTPGLNHTS